MEKKTTLLLISLYLTCLPYTFLSVPSMKGDTAHQSKTCSLAFFFFCFPEAVRMEDSELLKNIWRR